MPQINSTLPLPGITLNATADPEIVAAISTIISTINGGLDSENLAANAVALAALQSNSVDSSKVVDASLTDADLHSPNNAVYRTFGSYPLVIVGNHGVTKYWANSGDLIASGFAGDPTVHVPDLVEILHGDLLVNDKATKLRLTVILAANATSLGSAVAKVGLYPITAGSGASGSLNITLGTVVTGSQVTINSAQANGTAAVVGADFAIPSDGPYAIGVDISTASVPAACALAGSVAIQVRNV